MPRILEALACKADDRVSWRPLDAKADDEDRDAARELERVDSAELSTAAAGMPFPDRPRASSNPVLPGELLLPEDLELLRETGGSIADDDNLNEGLAVLSVGGSKFRGLSEARRLRATNWNSGFKR